MQKISKKASILIWSIILSLILSVTFISLSNKINLNLKQNISLTKNFEETSKTNENLKKIENIFKEIKILSLKENIDLIKLNNFFIKENEKIENYYQKKIEEIENKKTLNDEEKANIIKEKEEKKEFLKSYKTSEYKKSEIKKFFEEIEKLKKFSKDLEIFFDLKEENYLLKNGKKLEIIIPANGNISVKISGGKLDFKTKNIILDNEKDDLKNNFIQKLEENQNLKDEEKEEKIKNFEKFLDGKEVGEIGDSTNFSAINFYKKIDFENNSGEYSKINIISSNYIISPKKKFQIFEIFSKGKILKSEGFLEIN